MTDSIYIYEHFLFRISALFYLFNPSNAEATFVQSSRFFENHLNPVMLAFIGERSLTTHVPVFASFFSFFSSF